MPNEPKAQKAHMATDPMLEKVRELSKDCSWGVSCDVDGICSECRAKLEAFPSIAAYIEKLVEENARMREVLEEFGLTEVMEFASERQTKAALAPFQPKPNIAVAECDGRKFPYQGKPHLTDEMVEYAEQKLSPPSNEHSQ